MWSLPIELQVRQDGEKSEEDDERVKHHDSTLYHQGVVWGKCRCDILRERKERAAKRDGGKRKHEC